MTSDAGTLLRVASVPTAHPYVRAVTAESTGIEVLPEPSVADRPPGEWWPPVLLDPEYLRRHGQEIDVLHLHFGMESVPTHQLHTALRTLRELRIPLVYTLHDLENPQLTHQDAHLAQLDAVVRSASEVITLTPGAAGAIRVRWAREATVIPHPRIAVGSPTARARQGDGVVVGAHLRDLRPNIAGVAVTRELAAAVTRLRGDGHDVSARIRVNASVRDQDAAAVIAQIARSTPGLELERGPRQSDAELEQWIADRDAVVLPYRHGTHSGFAELCWDLGVPVLDTGSGHIAEQHPGDVTVFHLGDASSLEAALAAVTRTGDADRRQLVEHRRDVRDVQSREIGAAHRDVYLRARGAGT